MLTSWSVLLAVVSVIVLLVAGVTVVIVFLVRRSDRRLGHDQGPVAPPGQPERNAAAAAARVQHSRGLEPPAP